MELRHLRCFVAVAEELHFTRAAVRLHIEQSPLSRTIRELESDLGATLFERNRRGTQLTWAGQVLLEDARRVFAVLEQARTNVRAAATGYRGMLRLARATVLAIDYVAPTDRALARATRVESSAWNTAVALNPPRATSSS